MNNKQTPNDRKKSEFTGQDNGPQGVDKAPGEEPSNDNEQFTQQTQKGKKVDADLEKESDRPAGQSLKNKNNS